MIFSEYFKIIERQIEIQQTNKHASTAVSRIKANPRIPHV